MDFLVGVLCISIGCAMAWVLALYTGRGPAQLIADTALGIAGVAICAYVLADLTPVLRLAGVVVLGLPASYLAIRLGDGVLSSARRLRG